MFGHQRGAEAVRRTVEGCRERGVRYLTLFAFSSENWRRPASEVDELMDLLRFYLRREIAELVPQRRAAARHRRPRRAARRHRRPDRPRPRRAAATTRGSIVTMALNYGSRREIAEAARRLAERAQAGRSIPRAIDEDLFGEPLSTAGHPRSRPADPDQRRAADQQFPALADGLYRARVRAGQLAGFRRGASARRDRASTSGASGATARPLASARSGAPAARCSPASCLAADRDRGGRAWAAGPSRAWSLAAVVLMAREWARLAARRRGLARRSLQLPRGVAGARSC